MRDPRFSSLERRLGPVVFHDISREALIAYLAEPSNRCRTVFNVNAHAINLALQDPHFCRLLNEADVCFCDGFGVKVLAFLFRAGRVRHRVTVPDFLEPTFAAIYCRRGTAFLIGDDQGVAHIYAAQLNARYPKLVSGATDGYFQRGPVREKNLIALLNKTRPDFVPVGMGMPRQEKWIAATLPQLPPAVYLAVGSGFSWLSQSRKRGPRWAVDNGLEWFFRLLYEPRRVWRRYLLGLPEVVVRLVLWHLAQKKQKPVTEESRESP